jgi:hypothetical protein
MGFELCPGFIFFFLWNDCFCPREIFLGNQRSYLTDTNFRDSESMLHIFFSVELSKISLIIFEIYIKQYLKRHGKKNFFSFIRMCIQCLGHFYPLLLTPSLSPAPSHFQAESVLPLSLIFDEIFF